MSEFFAPHEAHDKVKLASLVESFRTGKDVPPVVVFGDNALCGSHRIAAYNEAMNLWNDLDSVGWDSDKPVLDAIELSEEDWAAACKEGDVDSLFDHCDYNDICGWVLTVTSDSEIIDALSDQH